MVISVTRTLIIYILVVIALRVMGKRQIGELQPTELVVAIMISDLATVPMSEISIPLFYGIAPIFTLVVCEMILSHLCIKIPKIRLTVTGRPSYIIKDGIVNQQEMKKARYSLADLMEELRMLNIFDISSVHCAILETNGKISVVTDECRNDMAYVLICDGKVQKRTLEESPYSMEDVTKFMGKNQLENIFLLSVNSNKKVYCIIKE